jgi:hypothetical protein
MLDGGVADTMEAMTASLLYLLLRRVLQILTQLARDGGAKDVEILVLRHQVAVYRARTVRILRELVFWTFNQDQVHACSPDVPDRGSDVRLVAAGDARRAGDDR